MAALTSLKDFRIERMLSESTSRKSIALLGRLEGAEGGGQAIVYLEKKPFQSDKIAEALSEGHTLDQNFHNAEYAVYELVRVFRETGDVYRRVTLPYIEREELGGRIEWVHNILDKKKESERILLEDADAKDGFILLPDMKWDQKSTSELYCLAIANRRDLPTLRSLTPEHLPLLRNVLSKGYQLLETRFGVRSHHVRAYLHYQPTFYHLHVHFTHVDMEGPSMEAGKAHLVQDVIDNIEAKGDYYQSVPLSMVLRTSLGLWKELESAGCVNAD